MNHDGRALDEESLQRIQANIFNGLYNDWEINRLFETIQIQRKVLRELLNKFTTEPLKLVSFADPIRNSELRHFKELVAMEDGR